MNGEPTVPETAGGLSAGEAFALLGSEVRVSILQALWEASRSDETPIGFTALRQRVGLRDSGQFNYHLNKLTGHFVRHTDEGYSLRAAGAAVVSAILSGAYDHAGLEDPLPVEDPCPNCGGDLEFRYEEERVTVSCTDCADFVSTAAVPSGVFADREQSAWPRVFNRWIRKQIQAVTAGFCAACNGPSEGRLVRGVDLDMAGVSFDEDEVVVKHECARCGDRVLMTVGEAVLDHPEVVAFHNDHGIDLREAPSWRLSWTADDPAVESVDPLRVRLRIHVDDDALDLVVDEDVTVVEAERN